MQLTMLKSKIHHAQLTACELNYQGSLSIDRNILDAAGILPFEKILVVNQTNGQRLETYAIESPRGSLEFCLNGAAARLGMVGDTVTIMAFATLTLEEAVQHKPTVVVLSDGNKTLKTL